MTNTPIANAPMLPPVLAVSTTVRCVSCNREKASGARADRPELLRMIEDLQSGEVVIAEKMGFSRHTCKNDSQSLTSPFKSWG